MRSAPLQQQFSSNLNLQIAHVRNVFLKFYHNTISNIQNTKRRTSFLKYLQTKIFL